MSFQAGIMEKKSSYRWPGSLIDGVRPANVILHQKMMMEAIRMAIKIQLCFLEDLFVMGMAGSG